MLGFGDFKEGNTDRRTTGTAFSAGFGDFEGEGEQSWWCGGGKKERGCGWSHFGALFGFRTPLPAFCWVGGVGGNAWRCPILLFRGQKSVFFTPKRSRKGQRAVRGLTPPAAQEMEELNLKEKGKKKGGRKDFKKGKELRSVPRPSGGGMGRNESKIIA